MSVDTAVSQRFEALTKAKAMLDGLTRSDELTVVRAPHVAPLRGNHCLVPAFMARGCVPTARSGRISLVPLLGQLGLGNSLGGILIGGKARKNKIGEPQGNQKTDPLNLISGNTGVGVTFTTGTERNVLRNSYVGFDRHGFPLVNTAGNVVDNGTQNKIKSTTP